MKDRRTRLSSVLYMYIAAVFTCVRRMLSLNLVGVLHIGVRHHS